MAHNQVLADLKKKHPGADIEFTEAGKNGNHPEHYYVSDANWNEHYYTKGGKKTSYSKMYANDSTNSSGRMKQSIRDKLNGSAYYYRHHNGKLQRVHKGRHPSPHMHRSMQP